MIKVGCRFGIRLYKNSGTSLIKDDAIFINYSEILDDGKIHRTVKDVYDMIKNNFYADQNIFDIYIYIWIKNYYLESLQKVETESLHYNTKEQLKSGLKNSADFNILHSVICTS